MWPDCIVWKYFQFYSEGTASLGGGALLSVVPLSRIAFAAAGGCVSLPRSPARDAIPFLGYFSSFSLEQMCVLSPFPRAILYPAVQGGLTGVDGGQSTEKWDQNCKKTAADL